MYAIIQKGAHQYQLKPGQFVRFEKLPLEKGSTWTCKDILVLQEEKGNLVTGKPYVDKAQIQGRVIRHGKSKKILVFKKNRRKGYRKTQGHRQEFTEVYIESLSTPSGKVIKKKLAKKQTLKEKSKE